MTRHALIWLFALMSVLAGSISAQTQNRQYRQGQDGKLSWVPFQARPCDECSGKKLTECAGCAGGHRKLPAKCMECNGKKKAPCRTCFGLGESHDSFRHMKCHPCDAKGFVQCGVCAGKVELTDTRGRKTGKCYLCKKKGGFPCLVCNGKRVVELFDRDVTKLTADQIEPMEAKARRAADAAKAFLDGEGASRHYDATKKKILKAFPEYKKLLKRTDKWIDTYTKRNRSATNLKANLANFRKAALNRIYSPVATQANVLKNCQEILKRNADK